VTTDRHAAIINEGMVATKSTHVVIKGRIRTVASADGAARHRFVDTVLKLKSAYLAQEVEVTAVSYEERLRVIMDRVQSQQ